MYSLKQSIHRTTTFSVFSFHPRASTMKNTIASTPFLLKTTLAAALLLPAMGAMAGDSGWYGSVSAGRQTTDSKAVNEGTNSPGTPSYELKNSNVGGFAIGRQLGNGLRVEAELRQRTLDVDSSYRAGPVGGRSSEQFSVAGQLRSTTVMVNGLYDLPVSGAFKPYVKAGLGLAHNRSEADINVTPTFAAFGLPANFRSPYPKGSDTSLAYAFGFGVGYDITQDVTLDLGYQYINLGRAKTGVDMNGDVFSFDKPASHEVTVGLRYQF
jgi:opacity protein-like surface antigen